MPGLISKLGTAAIGRSGKTSQPIFHFNIFIGEREKGVGLTDALNIHNTSAVISLNINNAAKRILQCF